MIIIIVVMIISPAARNGHGSSLGLPKEAKTATTTHCSSKRIALMYHSQ
jgi:hypothetical protein